MVAAVLGPKGFGRQAIAVGAHEGHVGKQINNNRVLFSQLEVSQFTHNVFNHSVFGSEAWECQAYNLTSYFLSQPCHV
jgi:hypothetical protein